MTVPFRSGTKRFSEADREHEAALEREHVRKGLRRRFALRSGQRYDVPGDPKLVELWRRMQGERADD